MDQPTTTTDRPVEEIGAYDARGRWGEILEEVLYHGKRYIVKRHGKPMAVIMPVDEYQYLTKMSGG